MSQPVLTLTEAAAARIKTLLESRGKPTYGIRIGVQTKGCSGLAYVLEFAEEAGAYDEKVEAHGVSVLIDPKAVMFILGSCMDYVEDKMSSGFIFKNPNEKGRCGCGESFRV
jgi:iron-sulfur cluster assembly protein